MGASPSLVCSMKTVTAMASREEEANVLNDRSQRAAPPFTQSLVHTQSTPYCTLMLRGNNTGYESWQH